MSVMVWTRDDPALARFSSASPREWGLGVNLQRCILGASGRGSLQDLEHCYATPVSGCRCSDCSGAAKSSAAPAALDLGGAATAPDEYRAQYRAYLEQAGR